MIAYETQEQEAFELTPPGTYKALISKVEISSMNKLIVDFDLVDHEDMVHTAFIVPKIMEGEGFCAFANLINLVHPEGVPSKGEFDEQVLVGQDCMLTIVHREGKGKHEGKTFANVLKIEPIEDKKKQ